MFQKIDTDQDGFIDYTEFIAASIDQNIYLREDKIFRIFQMIDTNGDGKICSEDLKNNFNEPNTDSNLLKIIEEVDHN
jgi:calcium-dependent protein kinase